MDKEMMVVRRTMAQEMRRPVNREECEERLAILEGEVPEKYRGHVEKLKGGSLRAAVTLHCLQCVGYQRVEVRDCSSLRCPLWAFRPYQGGSRREAREGVPA